MPIPVYMQNFKAAGVYRVIFDRSQVLNQDLATLRLVVGYSPKGPFNAVTYVTNIARFRELYGEGTKTLEKRGCYFHRIAEQCLADSPILCLNLKKFENEKITASTVDTNFNVKNPIDTLQIPVEDIYDTTRFWTLSADKLNNVRGAEYINIATTNTKQTSGTYFIRKASGAKVQAYNISVKDYYTATKTEIPEFLLGYETSLMSDFMAEIYVFNGKFVAEQVLASDSLKKYFAVDAKGQLKLRQYVIDSFGDYVDTLDELYNDETSGALGHYIGSLIPYFQDTNGKYAALDILFNQDQAYHNMMMAFNVDMLEEDGIANIDLSGSRYIATVSTVDANAHPDHQLSNDYKAYGSSVVCVEDIWNGTAKTNLLSNKNAPVVADVILFNASVFKGENTTVEPDENGDYPGVVKNELKFKATKKVSGTLYVSDFNESTVTLSQVGIDYAAGAEAIAAAHEAVESTHAEVESTYAEVGTTKAAINKEDQSTIEAYEAAKEAYAAAKEAYAAAKEEYANVKEQYTKITVEVPENYNINKVLYHLGAGYKYTDEATGEVIYVSYKDWNSDNKYTDLTGDGLGSYYTGEAYPTFHSLEGPKKVITSLNRDMDSADDSVIKLSTDSVKCTVEDVYVVTTSEYCSSSSSETNAETANGYDGVLIDPTDNTKTWATYGSSISFIEIDNENWTVNRDSTKYTEDPTDVHTYTIYCPASANSSLSAIISKGDRFLAEDGQVDMDGDGDYEDEKPNGYYDVIAVQSVDTKCDKFGVPIYHEIKLTGKPMLFKASAADGVSEAPVMDEDMPDYAQDYIFGSAKDKERTYLVRIDRALNQEIGDMYPTYLEGYTYENPKPNGTGMMAKLNWQNFMLSCLSEYEGLRTALLNKSEVDYRYVIDTWESYVDSSLKSVLSGLCKEKQSAFAILNFPSVRTFVKCPYTSFTNDKGVFNVQYVVDGKNKKKAAVKGFGIPSDSEGASYCAFYTPLKFSDGYIDSIIPSAGIVSNLYMEKYRSRQPYNIIAGPNYGAISASGLVGPDYNYSKEELNIIEPYGVNCMVYRPGFGTFINANQTAKQTPKSALSSVNVRELVIYLMDEIERVLQAYQWEFNNAQVRNAIKDRADAICARVQVNGGLQRYLNIMDETNNDADIIDNEMAVLSTHIEPGRGMGKMVHELTIYRTGGMVGMTSSVLE